MKRRRPFLGLGLSLASLLVFDQVLLYGVLADGEFRGRRIAPFDPPLFCADHEASLGRLEEYVATGSGLGDGERFDAELGWCNPKESGSGDFRYDWAGCRIDSEPLAREKGAGVRRIVAVGGSFTRGDEVGPLECWPAQLERERQAEKLEVCNLGIGAYGPDQALLRYRRDGRALEADVVWLGWFPQASLRTLTVYRPALRHWSKSVAFKPRFKLGTGAELELVLNPARSLEETVRLVHSQEDFLQAVGHDDFWIERARPTYLPEGSHWSHYFAFTRILSTLHEKGQRSAAPWVADAESEVHRLMLSIVRSLEHEATADGARFALLVLPGRPDLEHRQENGGRGYWEELARELERTGIEVIDLAPALIEAGALEDRARFWMPGEHYSGQANAVVARELTKRL